MRSAGLVGALRLPTLRGEVLCYSVGALRLPTLQKADNLLSDGCASLTHPTNGLWLNRRAGKRSAPAFFTPNHKASAASSQLTASKSALPPGLKLRVISALSISRNASSSQPRASRPLAYFCT